MLNQSVDDSFLQHQKACCFMCLTHKNSLRAILILCFCAAMSGTAYCEDTLQERNIPNVTIQVRNKAGEPQPCSIYLKTSEGTPVLSQKYPCWKNHFSCEGIAHIKLMPGVYHYEIESGPEWKTLSGQWTVTAQDSQKFHETIHRSVDLEAEGWYAADLHIHRPVEHIPLLMKASGLKVAPTITWWNANNPWKTLPLPESQVIKTVDGRFYGILAGEDERGGGALIYYRMKQPIDITTAEREFPSSLNFLNLAHQHEPNLHVSIEKPFWKDVPLWLASGKVDSIGIAHNHMWREDQLDNEAWGMPRDRNQWPAPHGNALWTQELYYRILNCGFRIPPVAGSASGVLPNPVGYNRCYAKLEGPLDYGSWWRALSLGHVFVSNGPLLRVKANGQNPGYEFPMTDTGMSVTLTGKLSTQASIDSVEVIHNGSIIQRWEDWGTESQHILNKKFRVNETGWFLVRVFEKKEGSLRFASSAPFYVGPNKSTLPIRRDAVEFFLNWALERRKDLSNTLSGIKKTQVLADHDLAIRFWEQKLTNAPE